ncbi:MAG: class I SAM-dependent methyltransferase [Proteobacteria bacterium]|nr:class I SAM-dependent methyltransferase [Pseudomonadota bacterium]
MQQDPLPKAEALPDFYPTHYHAYHYKSSRIGDALKRRYSRRVGRDIRARIGREGRILDLGCADGSFLAALEDLGSWELHGIDLNPEVVRRPRSPRLRLRVGQLGPDTYPAQYFDAIVATHLVEHVVDPLELLRVCARSLRPGGVLVGELPNWECWDRWLFGRHWGGLHLPRHLFFWDPEAFARLGRRAGFAEVEVHPMLQPAHWAISLQNWLVAHLGLERWLRHGRLPLYTPLVLAALPINVLQNALGSPSIMGFCFRTAAS